MKHYAILYTIIAYTALGHAMDLQTPNPIAIEIARAKSFPDRISYAMEKLMTKVDSTNKNLRRGALIALRATLAVCKEEEDAWLNASQRTPEEKDWYRNSLATIQSTVKNHTTTPSVQEQSAKKRNNFVEIVLATEAARQAQASSAAKGREVASSSLEAMQAGYTISLTELLQLISDARQKHDALEQERSSSTAALQEVETRLTALIEDQNQLGTVSAKSSQAAGTLAILIATLASDAVTTSQEVASRKAELAEAQAKQHALAQQMAGTVDAANGHYNRAAAERSSLERQLQDLAFETEKVRKAHGVSMRKLEQLGEARDLAAAFAQEGRLMQRATNPTDD